MGTSQIRLKINPYKLRVMVLETGKSAAEISKKIGYSEGYVSNIFYYESISLEGAIRLKAVMGFNPYDYIVDDDIDLYFGDTNKDATIEPSTEEEPKPDKKDDEKWGEDNFIMFLKTINYEIAQYIQTLEKEKK